MSHSPTRACPAPVGQCAHLPGGTNSPTRKKVDMKMALSSSRRIRRRGNRTRYLGGGGMTRARVDLTQVPQQHSGMPCLNRASPSHAKPAPT
jgi:hypothetical protein